MKYVCSLIVVVLMATSLTWAWDQPILVSNKVGTPPSPMTYRLMADSTEGTFDLVSLNGSAFLAYAEWDEANYRHFAKLAAFNPFGELWRVAIEVPRIYHTTLPSQVQIWNDHIFVIGQITFTDPVGCAPFIAKFDTLGHQEWFAFLITTNLNWLLWGPQLTINPINEIGIAHFTTDIARFQLINLETGQINGPSSGYVLPLYGSVGYCSFSYKPAWLSGAWWFIHRSDDYFTITIASITPAGTVTSTPIYWTHYSSDGVFPASGDSLSAITPNYQVTQLTVSTTSLNGNKGSEVAIAPIPSNIWSIYDTRQAADGTIVAVLIRDMPSFSADVTIVKTDDSVLHTVLPFDMLPASCQAELIGDQLLGLTRSVNQKLLFAAINLNDGSVVQEDTIGRTSPNYSSVNWADLCGDQNNGAFIAWFVEEGISFPGCLYIQWVPGNATVVAGPKVTMHNIDNVHISPNPFNPTTTISYTLSNSGNVTLSVYDINGRLVNNLVNGWAEAGTHSITFDGSALSSGIYLYRLKANNHVTSGKMMLVK